MGMYTDVARRVLLKAGGPLHVREIVKRAKKDPAFKPTTKTVRASMWTCIYEEMKRNKERSPFVRLEGSVFDLRDRHTDTDLGATPSTPSTPSTPVRPVAGMQVVDENGNVVGTAQEVGVAKDQGMVLIVRTQDGNDVNIELSRIGKAGEIILLRPNRK